MLHLDCTGELKLGDQFILDPVTAIEGRPDLSALLMSHFPDGLSRHGMRYLFCSSPDPSGPLKTHLHMQPDGREPLVVMPEREFHALAAGITNYQLETVFELVRRVVAADMPSRFVSVFAFEFAKDLRRFREEFRASERSAFVCELEGPSGPKFDMQWLRGGSGLAMWSQAERYWSGQPTKEPLWEYLLPVPQRVAGRRAL